VTAVAEARPVRDPAALRPQPKRDGPDFWSTPPCLTRALVRHVLPTLPPCPIWECAAGDGPLVEVMRQAGRTVFASDLHPRVPGVVRCDFLHDEVPQAARGAIATTNPPFSRLNGFIGRGFQLLDRGVIPALIFLLRHDHLQGAERVDVLNRAVLDVHCHWRPIWLACTDGNPLWSFHWIVWQGGHCGPRRTLSIRKDDGRGLLFEGDGGEPDFGRNRFRRY
jgi:hypothetical protein